MYGNDLNKFGFCQEAKLSYFDVFSKHNFQALFFHFITPTASSSVNRGNKTCVPWAHMTTFSEKNKWMCVQEIQLLLYSFFYSSRYVVNYVYGDHIVS